MFPFGITKYFSENIVIRILFYRLSQNTFDAENQNLRKYKTAELIC